MEIPALMMFLLFLFLLFISSTCTSSNLNIEPGRVTLNSTTHNQAKFLCTKEINDNRGFEISLSDNISSKYIQISTNHLNNTAIEIILDSFDYIGGLQLICSSKGEKDSGSYSDIVIAKAPGLITRAEPCIVYYDEYIDCIIKAPVMVPVITNRLRYNFDFREIRLPSQPTVYRKDPDPQPVKINSIDKTLTFRWFPRTPGYFPLGLRMIIYGTITDFGTDNHTMDMTPIFRISSNFTVPFISSTDLRIEFNHGKFSSRTVCHGNLTQDDQIDHLNQRENQRTFDESKQTIIRVGHLPPNTWYRLCFHCRRHAPFQTISDIQCNRYQTLKTTVWSIYYVIPIIVIFCALLVTIIMTLKRTYNCEKIREKLSQCQHSERSGSHEDIPFTRTPLGPEEYIPHDNL